MPPPLILSITVFILLRASGRLYSVQRKKARENLAELRYFVVFKLYLEKIEIIILISLLIVTSNVASYLFKLGITFPIPKIHLA